MTFAGTPVADRAPAGKVYSWDWLEPSKEKGWDKTFRQCHIGKDGLPIGRKGQAPWPAYREREVLEAIKEIPPEKLVFVLVQSGEKCVEMARGIGLTSITFQGSSWGADLVASLARFHLGPQRWPSHRLEIRTLPPLRQA